VRSQVVSLIPPLGVVLAAVAFDLYCLRDLARADLSLVFPPQVWVGLIVVFTPFGGIAYLKLGRRR
jgi:hypothetical protein